mgnify:CR=1 FL=1
MKFIYAVLDRTTTKLGFALLMGFLLIVMGAVIYSVSQIQQISGNGILDFELGHTAERVQEVLGSYGEDGMQWYSRVQLLDVFNPLFYTLVFMSVIHKLVRQTRHAWLAILPIFAGLLDYLENILLVKFVRDFPNIDADSVAIANALSLMKRGALAIAIAGLAVAIIFWLKQRRQP